MKTARILLTVLLVAAAWLGGYGYGRLYGPKPGPNAGPGAAATEQQKPRIWYCPMHPTFRRDRPGECGICGMRLAPMEDAVPAPAADRSAMPMGTIRVNPEKQQLIGVRYGTVEMGAGKRTFRAVGKVGADETRVAKVHAKVDAWIEKVFVDFTGKMVHKGQPLLTMYSPEMLATQQEYLLALRSREVLKSDSLVAASRRRLELWDLSDEQIREIERTGQPIKSITLYSPIHGYVMERKAFPNQRITPETELYTVVDHDQVWIMADVFENEASMVRVGMPATVILSYEGGRRFAARVSYIHPHVDMATRTLKVRLETKNPDHALRLDMFVDVEFASASQARLSVPSEAVLDSGLRKTVFVDRGNGYLEPRQVETGERLGDRIEIVKGLKTGERIVTSGTFLIDSESQLKSAASGMAGHQHGGGTPPPKASEPKPAAEGHKHD